MNFCGICGSAMHEEYNPDCGGDCAICIAECESMSEVENKYVKASLEVAFDAHRAAIARLMEISGD